MTRCTAFSMPLAHLQREAMQQQRRRQWEAIERAAAAASAAGGGGVGSGNCALPVR